MLKYLLLLIAFFNYTTAQAQAPKIEWAKNYGGSQGENANCIKATKDGGYIIAGSADSKDHDVTQQKGYGYLWIVKINSTGRIEWQKSYGGSIGEAAYCINLTEDGGYIVAGWTNSNDGDVVGYHYTPGNPQADYWIIKIDSVGNLQWQKTLGGTQDDIATSIIQTYDKGYIVAGSTESNDGDVTGLHFIYPNLNSDAWVVKLDSVGNIQWQKCLGGTGSETASSIVQTADSNYVFCGGTNSTDGDVVGKHLRSDAWVVKLGKTGNIIWQKCYGGNSIDGGNAILKLPDGGFVIGGFSTSSDGDLTAHYGDDQNADYWVFKTDSVGNLQWQKNYGGTDIDYLFDINYTNDGGYILIGYTDSNDGDVTGNHNLDYWFVKIDSIGNLQWQKCVGGSNAENGLSILQTKDGGYIAAGVTQSHDGDVLQNYGLQNIWVVKLAPPPQAIKVIANNPQLLIYPNPANSAAYIATQNIQEIRLIDALGRVYMNQKINNTNAAYTYLPLNYIANGTYVVQAIDNNGQVRVGKLMVVK